MILKIDFVPIFFTLSKVFLCVLRVSAVNGVINYPCKSC
jgi:hypothetical protein